MTIDISGGTVPKGETPAVTAPVRASDMQSLPDDVLLKELGLDTISATPATPLSGSPAATGDGGVADPVSGDQADAGAAPGVTAETQAETAAQTSAREEAERVAAEAAAAGEPKKPLQAQFAVYEGETELETPELNIRFRAAGEERDLPLDRVVKLAQQGFYNETRAEEMRQFREQLPFIQDQLQGLQNENQMLMQGWRRVLQGDEDYLEQERNEFLRTQSPEARAQRLEQELAQERGQTRLGQQEQQAAVFVQQHLVPTLQAIETEHPEVSFEEIVGRFNLLTAPLMQRGQIPPARFRQVQDLIESELRPWVDSQNERRLSSKKAQTTVVERATADAAAAKRQTARAVMPQGTQTTGSEKPVQKVYKQASDILDDLPNIAKPTV